MAGRGKLTEKIQEIARYRIGREITTTELRLYPYLDFVIKNDQKIDERRINNEEKKLLYILMQEKHIDNLNFLSMSKEFYYYIQEVLWEAYVVGNKPSFDMVIKEGEENAP